MKNIYINSWGIFQSFYNFCIILKAFYCNRELYLKLFSENLLKIYLKLANIYLKCKNIQYLHCYQTTFCLVRSPPPIWVKWLNFRELFIIISKIIIGNSGIFYRANIYSEEISFKDKYLFKVIRATVY